MNSIAGPPLLQFLECPAGVFDKLSLTASMPPVGVRIATIPGMLPRSRVNLGRLRAGCFCPLDVPLQVPASTLHWLRSVLSSGPRRVGRAPYHSLRPLMCTPQCVSSATSVLSKVANSRRLSSWSIPRDTWTPTGCVRLPTIVHETLVLGPLPLALGAHSCSRTHSATTDEFNPARGVYVFHERGSETKVSAIPSSDGFGCRHLV